MDNAARIPRNIIARGVHVAETPDRIEVSFRYLTPYKMGFAQGIVVVLLNLIPIIAMSELIQLGFSSAPRIEDVYFIADRYLCPLYHVYEFPRVYYCAWMTNWWGNSLSEGVIVSLAWLVNMVVWMFTIQFILAAELLPAICMRLPFLSSKTKVVFSPGEVAFGKKRLSVLSEGSSFRLDEAESIRKRRRRLSYEFGKQEIIYDLGAAKYRVAIISDQDYAGDVQNSLSLILEWAKMNFSARKSQPTASAVVEDPDDFLR
jgi:hypothetical protein